MKTIIFALARFTAHILKPFKLFAYRTRVGFLRRLILQFTTLIDFIFHFLCGQNEIMEIHQKVYKGNFIFGHGVMKTDYDSTVKEIKEPSMRTNHFMGIPVVSGNEVFVVNSPLISLGEPFRTLARQHVNGTIFNADFQALTYEDIKAKCQTTLDDWLADPKSEDITIMRSVSTRMVINVLQNIDVGKEVSESVTRAYLKHFVELSLFKNYLPLISGLIGSEKKIKKDAYYPLINLGVSPEVVDATLFAAMFSIGTLFAKCVDFLRLHQMTYEDLNQEERINYVTEVVRLYPTVTTTHRILTQPEEVTVGKSSLKLTEGDHIAYPFICPNKDEKVFECPHQIKLDRPEENYQQILSWSKGPHACPARNFSILATTVMLDALHQKKPLNSLNYKGSIL